MFGWVALGGGVAAFFSVTSVFMSFPTVNLGAALAVRGWRRDRTRTVRILLSAVAYNAAVLAAYLFLSGRSNAIMRSDFATGFMPLTSVDAAWAFFVRNGRRLLELGLPSWGQGELTSPVTFPGPCRSWRSASSGCWRAARRGSSGSSFWASTSLRRRERVAGLPAGDRPRGYLRVSAVDCLFTVGVHLATQALPVRRLIRLAAAILVMAIAVIAPVARGVLQRERRAPGGPSLGKPPAGR